MSDQNSLLFEGPVRVYLQGQNALLPKGSGLLDQGMLYCIGQENTELSVHDFRSQPVKSAKEAISKQYQNGFATEFNQRAWAQIHYDQPREKIEIELRDLDETNNSEFPLLWFGVLEDNLMPDYDVEWEVFKPLDSGQTAFVSLLPSPQSS